MMWTRLQTSAIAAVAILATAGCGDGGPRTDGANQALTEGTLPGGAPISVDVTAPVDGAVFSVGDPILVAGTAQVVPIEPEADTAIVIVLDVSGSTSQIGCTGDANNDGLSGRIIDCEIQAALALVEAAVDSQTVGEVGVVVFASTAAVVDVGPAPGVQVLTAPDADANNNGIPDLEEVLRSAFSNHPEGGVTAFTPVSVGNLTGYGLAVQAALDAMSASTMPNQFVAFMSDGLNNQPPSVASVLGGVPSAPIFDTFAVGSNASCVNNNSQGDLAEIAALTGGSCIDVTDPADLPDIVPALIVADLTDVVVTISGGDVVGTLPLATTTTPPLGAPKEVDFSADASGHGPGIYEICATATGHDIGDPESVTDCVTIRINAPPVALCAPRAISADANCQGYAEIDDGSFDPDGDALVCTQEPPGPYPLGDTAATLICVDAIGDGDSCAAVVSVVDDTAPTVVVGAPVSLWPPNHKYRTVSLGDCVEAVTDNCDSIDVGTSGVITRVTSDEAEDEGGDGATCADAVITSDTTVDLRAERNGAGDGRVYRIHFVVSDAAGNQTESSCEVQVAHDQSPPATPAVDSGCAWCTGDECGLCPDSSPGC